MLWIVGSLELGLCGLPPTMATILIWHTFLLISLFSWERLHHMSTDTHTHMHTIIWYHRITLTKLLLNRMSSWENLISPWREIIPHRHSLVPETLVKPSRLKREKCYLFGIKHPQVQLRPWNMCRPDTYFFFSVEPTTVSRFCPGLIPKSLLNLKSW